MAPGKGGYKQINKALDIGAFEDYLDGQQAALPALKDVEQVSPRIIRILGQNPGKVRGTSFYSSLAKQNVKLIFAVYPARDKYIHCRHWPRTPHH